MFGGGLRAITRALDDSDEFPDGRPLAPAFYRALVRVFGSVRISSRGQSFRHDVLPGRRGPRSRFTSWGEMYGFRCPFCGSGAGWASYMWGQPDPVSGYPLTQLCNCFKCDFGTEPGRRKEFEFLVTGVAAGWGKGQLLPAPEHHRAQVVVRGPVEMPGLVFNLATLHPEHVACQYIRGRGFDPVELGEQYDAGYCVSIRRSEYDTALGRVVFPFRIGGDLVGWQARALGHYTGKMKYFIAPGSKKTLFNYDVATKGRLIVLTEGVLDAISTGPHAIAVFGHSLTEIQQDMLFAIKDREPLLVVLVDPEEEKAFGVIGQQLGAAFPDRILPVRLPEVVAQEDCREWPIKKVDPGSLKREAIWGWVAKAASEAGINIEEFL
jgi:hypothetical protein